MSGRSSGISAGWMASLRTWRGFQLPDSPHPPIEKWRVSEARFELIAQDLACGAARRCDQDEAADIAGVTARRKSHEAAFAVAREPDAGGAGFLLDDLDPRVYVGGIAAHGGGVALRAALALPVRPRLSMRTVAMPFPARPSARSLYGEPLMPSGLLPSRSVGPEPGRMRTACPFAFCGASMVPLSAPAGPGASTLVSTSAGAATASAGHNSKDRTTKRSIASLSLVVRRNPIGER